MYFILKALDSREGGGDFHTCVHWHIHPAPVTMADTCCMMLLPVVLLRSLRCCLCHLSGWAAARLRSADPVAHSLPAAPLH